MDNAEPEDYFEVYDEWQMKQIFDEEEELKFQKQDLYDSLFKRCDRILKTYSELRSRSPLNMDIKENRALDSQLNMLKISVINIVKFKQEWG